MTKLTLVFGILLCTILCDKVVLGYPADPEGVEVIAAPNEAAVAAQDTLEPSDLKPAETFGYGYYPGFVGYRRYGLGSTFGYRHSAYGHWNYGEGWGGLYRHPPIYPVWG